MTTIRIRRGIASEWTSVNPILALGELGLETDTHKLKGGDGVTEWSGLPYISAGGGGGGGGGGGNSWGSITGTLSSQTDLQTALNGKANTVHTHVISDVTDLQTSLDAKQETLISGTNIKTVNGTTLLGSGNVSVSSNLTVKSGTVTISKNGGAFEHEQTITDADVSTSSFVNAWLASGLSTDENEAEMIDLKTISTIPGTGNFNVKLSFSEKTYGPIKFNYIIGA